MADLLATVFWWGVVRALAAVDWISWRVRR